MSEVIFQNSTPQNEKHRPYVYSLEITSLICFCVRCAGIPTDTPTDVPTLAPTLGSTTGYVASDLIRTTGLVFVEADARGSLDTDDTISNSSVGLFQETAFDASGAVSVTAGLFHATTSQTSPLLPSETVNAVVLEDTVVRDWLKVRVALQVRDGAYNTMTSRGRVYINVWQSASENAKQASCFPHKVHGTCVATAALSSAWLTGENIQVSYGLSPSEQTTSVSVVHTTLYTEPIYTDNFLLVLPSRPLLVHDTFDITVHARAPSDIESAKFTLFIDDTDAVEFVGSPQGTHEATWTYQFSARPDGLTVVLNRKPDSPGVSQSAQAAQKLLTTSMRVLPGTTPGNVSMRLRVQEMNAPVPINPSGQVIPMGGFVLGHVEGVDTVFNGPGVFKVVDDLSLAVFSSTSTGQGTFVNTAPFTTTPIAISVTAMEVHRFGDTLRGVAIASCMLLSSDADDVVELLPSCDMQLTQYHTNGAVCVNVSLTVNGLSAILPLRVWMPELPLRLGLDTTVLKPITLYDGSSPMYSHSESGCAVRIMSTALHAATRFYQRSPAGVVHTEFMDVAGLVWDQMQSSNASVASIDTEARRIRGHTSGLVTISFSSALLGSITLTVDTRVTVHIASTDVLAFAAVAIDDRWVQTNIVTHMHKLQTSVHVVQDAIRQEGFEGRQYLVASMAVEDPVDGSLYFEDITFDTGFYFESNNSQIALIANASSIIAMGSGTAAVRIIWTNPMECDALQTTRMSSAIDVAVALPAASSVRILDDGGNSLTSAVLAHYTDPAYIAGSAVFEARISVLAYYPGYSRDLTVDPRTVFAYNTSLYTVGACTSEGNIGFVCVAALLGVAGTDQLTVAFTHESVTAVVDVVVVRGRSISVTPRPYPRWPGSSGVRKHTMSRIVAGGLYQQLLLVPTLHRSDGLEFDIDAPRGVMFSTVTGENVVSLHDAGSDTVVLGLQSGTASVAAVFAGLVSAPVALTVSDVSVDVARVHDLFVVGSSGGTVGGVKDAAGRFSLAFAAEFTDGTIITRSAMFTHLNATTRANLFLFSSSDGNTLEIDSQSGAIIPRDNSIGNVTLSVAAYNTAVVTSTAVVCNLISSGIDVDLATDFSRLDRGLPLSPIQPDDVLVVKVYITSGSTLVGSVTIDLSFSSELLDFVAAERGGDDGVWADTVTGESWIWLEHCVYPSALYLLLLAWYGYDLSGTLSRFCLNWLAPALVDFELNLIDPYDHRRGTIGRRQHRAIRWDHYGICIRRELALCHIDVSGQGTQRCRCLRGCNCGNGRRHCQ